MVSRPTPRRRAGAAAVALALAFSLGACGDDSDDAAAPNPQPAASAESDVEALTFTLDDEAIGPAPPIPDAVSGGTITVLERDDFAHLDPARIYISTFQGVSNLITRTLTTYRQSDGAVSLVGDLATDTGTSDDGGKTWTYTLREGITWEDGSTITAADMKYGLERLFEPDYVEGPTYLQEWLTGRTDFRKVYAGPYGGESFNRIEARDDRTLVLRFPKARPDVPFALALTSGAPVKKSADTRGKYDNRPFASGPYKIESRKIDRSLTLVRNTAWKPESDPARHQHPDRYEFEFGAQDLEINRRLLASTGDDAAATPFSAEIPSELAAQVKADPDAQARTVDGVTPFQNQFTINNRRVTDVAVREALLYAFPRQQVRQILGGPTTGDFASTLASPTLLGHAEHDLFDPPPEGDTARARAALEAAGKLGQKIVYAYIGADEEERAAVVIQQALTEAGFDVVTKPLSGRAYDSAIYTTDNSFDLYRTGWGFDWPSGSTVYPPTLDGRKIADFGTNAALFNSPEINAEMDRILEITDPVAAGKEWAALDKRIMMQVPAIPFTYDRAYQIVGSRIGGYSLDLVLGQMNLNGLYVRPS